MVVNKVFFYATVNDVHAQCKMCSSMADEKGSMYMPRANFGKHKSL